MFANFLEHTRCPESLLRPFVSEAQTTSDTPLTPSPSELLATLQEADKDGAELAVMLKDCDSAIDVLRLERYLDNSVSGTNPIGIKSLVRDCYYRMRPLFPVCFRKYLQRVALRGWDAIPFPAWPVDFTTEKLTEGIWQSLLRSQRQTELPFIWFWPDGRSSACIMTHDVETNIGRDYSLTMMKIEKRHGITSAFEVVPEQRYVVSDDFLQQIRDNGCELCIHGLNHDGHLFTSKAIFLERLAKINAYARDWGAIGFRSPVMYRNLTWLPALEFSYDMSVPNVAHLDPQRGGCCTVMPYFIGSILELPLTTTQDYSLFHILRQRSLDLWKQQITLIRERHGLISFIIHPDYVTESWSSNLYDALLGYLEELRSDHAVWSALPRDVNNWWRARREMRLIQQSETWRISGPQAERARVAYASLKNGQLAYRIDQNKAVASGG